MACEVDDSKKQVADLIFARIVGRCVDNLIEFFYYIAEQAGHFTLDDVAEAISVKMERRHPHIFGDAVTRPSWEDMKAAERTGESALDGVALALPALMRAEKLQKRAARTGFDWPDANGPRGKIIEELDEVVDATTDDAREDEVGDLLFAVVNFARHLQVDSEVALRRANAKFEGRFRAIETAPDFAALSLEEKEALWTAAKTAQRAL